VLTDEERNTLFSIASELKSQASIILISHRLQEIVETSDRIVIMKDGKWVTDLEAKQAGIPEIEQMMVGHAFAADRFREDEQIPAGDQVLLALENVSKRGAFEPLNFEVRQGEIVSLVGLVGSGKEAVCRCIAGLEKPDTGSIKLAGKRLTPGSPADAVRTGIGYVPIDRRSDGLALGMTIAENVNLLVLERLKVAGFISPQREKKNALRWIQDCRIKAPSPSTMCVNLSGGNQQKTVIAKWLTSKINLLVLDHPTRGVDVGAKDEIYRLIRQLARTGVGMIIMCDTLEEDIGLCSRMLIMKDGRLVNEVNCPPYRKPGPSDIISSIV
jgi:ribose transport system ATP-binding protein